MGRIIKEKPIDSEADNYILERIETNIPRWLFNHLVREAKKSGKPLQDLHRDILLKGRKKPSDKDT